MLLVRNRQRLLIRTFCAVKKFSLDDFKYFFAANSIWLDNDQFGHINHSTYLNMTETAIATVLCNSLNSPDENLAFTTSAKCKFIKQAAFPQAFMVGLALEDLDKDTRSMRWLTGIFPVKKDLASLAFPSSYSAEEAPKENMKGKPVFVSWIEQKVGFTADWAQVESNVISLRI